MTTAQPGQEQRMDTPPPIPNPHVHHGARRSPEDEALTFLRFNRDTHSKWAKYFEDNPEVEAEYLATGVWEGAADQRRVERQYNAAIATFERLAATRPTADLGEDGELIDWLEITGLRHVDSITRGRLAEVRDRLILYREAREAAANFLDLWQKEPNGADTSRAAEALSAVLSRSGG